MSRWKKEFDDHPIHGVVKDIQEHLDAKLEKADPNLEQERRRICKILEHTNDLLKRLDPELFPKATLDQLCQHLRHPNVAGSIQNYSSSSNPSHLKTANNYLSQHYLQQLLSLSATTKDATTLVSFKQSTSYAEQLIREISEREGEIKAKLDDNTRETQRHSDDLEKVTAQLQNLQVNHNQKISEWQSEFTSSQTTRAEEHSHSQISREERFSSSLKDWDQKFSDSHDSITSKQHEKMAASFAEMELAGETLIGDIKDKHAKVIELHGLVGTDSVAGGYVKAARDEKSAADFWRRVSLSSLIVTALWLALKYYKGFGQTSANLINWPEFITATSLTAILLTIAGYASKQSRLHRDIEKQMASYALETKALDPFIASLSETQQRELKIEMTKRLFGKHREQNPERSIKFKHGEAKDLSDIVVDAVSGSIGKINGSAK